MGLLSFIVLGALAGWIASMIMGNNAEQGAIGNIVVGILGAFVGGFIMSLVGGSGVTEFDLPSILVAIFGAVIVLFVKQKMAATS